MRIAFFTPLNPQKSGISDYSEELLPYLAEHMEIDVYTDATPLRDHPLSCRMALYPTHEFAARSDRYDLPIYQMGNAPYHSAFWDLLLRYPGLTVLHDLTLYHLVKARTLGVNNNVQGFLEEMEFAHGAEGLRQARRLMVEGKEPSPFDFPCNLRILQASPHVAVHSHFVAGQVREVVPTVPITVVPMHMETLPIATPDEVRKVRVQLGIKPDALMVASFGHISPNKRIAQALRAFSRLKKKFPQAVYILVGELAPDVEAPRLIRELGLGDSVKITGYVSMEAFKRYLIACDIALNLRYPTAGETSASVLRIMSAARPVLVSQIGFYLELPDAAAIKVPVDETEEEMIFRALVRLAHAPEEREAMGREGYRLVQEGHHPTVTAHCYVEAIERARLDMASLRLFQNMTDRIAHRMAEMGTRSWDAAQVDRVAGRMAELGIGRSGSSSPGW